MLILQHIKKKQKVYRVCEAYLGRKHSEQVKVWVITVRALIFIYSKRHSE